MKKIFILEPRSGLCNQLSCISIGVVLGEIFNRDIYFDKFQIHYKNEDNLIDINKIINLDYLNNYIKKELKLKVNIIKDLNEEQKKNIKILTTKTKEKISDIKDIDPLLRLRENIDIEILNIKNPISMHLELENYKLNEKIKSNIKFHQQFIENATKIREYFKLNHYCCIHIRMEDDAIKFMMSLLNKDKFNNINDIYRTIYKNEMKNLESLNMNIYVCTSLGIYENFNNAFYKILKKEYNLIDKNDLLDLMHIEGLDNNIDKRELYGIIDYIIAQDSSYFIGCDWSSFSIALKYNHMIKNKQCKMLQIWDICQKY